LKGVRQEYDVLLGALVSDFSLTRERIDYTTTLVSLNASAPEARAIEGQLEK